MPNSAKTPPSGVGGLLFISHDAKRTGAPLLLWRFLKLLKENRPDIQFEVLLKNGGALQADFENLASTYLWNEPTQQKNTFFKRVLLKMKNSFFKQNYQQKLKNHLSSKQFNLIVSNTLTNGDLLRELAPFSCPTITYPHELPLSLKLYSSPEDIAYNISITDYFMVPSQATKDNLIKTYHIPSEKIEVLLSLLPEIKTQEKENTRQKLNIPPNAFVVGSIGTADLRKGFDLFLQLAAKFRNQLVHFVWVGADKTNPDFFVFEQDCKKLGIANQVHFVESTPNVLDYLADFDIFALLSREDPYPLVVLEAALLAKPIICFDGAGGAKELIEHDAGFVVNYLNLEAFAEKINLLIQDRILLKQMGESAKSKVLFRHDETKAFNQFLKIINIVEP